MVVTKYSDWIQLTMGAESRDIHGGGFSAAMNIEKTDLVYHKTFGFEYSSS
jgi:hypothetical protein